LQNKVFVGNLNFQTTENELRELFSQSGEVVSVSIPTDRVSGRPRGFAFVEFSSSEAAASAIERFNDRELAGRNLRVNEATERAPRPPTVGAGYGGFAQDDRPRGGFARPKGSRRNLRARKRGL
jgi:RNA recognition motif-containing protein